MSQPITRSMSRKMSQKISRKISQPSYEIYCFPTKEQMIEIVKKELEKDKQKKEEIKREMQELEGEIKKKKELMAEYALQIGLTNLENKHNELRIEFNKRPKTSCTHPETRYCGPYDDYECVICGANL